MEDEGKGGKRKEKKEMLELRGKRVRKKKGVLEMTGGKKTKNKLKERKEMKNNEGRPA